MGVKLKDIIEPEKIGFKDLEGRAVSIDAFNTLYQFFHDFPTFLSINFYN